MVEGGEHFGFALKPRQPPGVEGHRRRQHLHSDLSLQLRVDGPIHLTHTALVEEPLNDVHADPGTGRQRRRDVTEQGGGGTVERTVRRHGLCKERLHLAP
jgi:hypothetical protein